MILQRILLLRECAQVLSVHSAFKELIMILVTGGAGYIGSHCVRELQERGIGVVVYDGLNTFVVARFYALFFYGNEFCSVPFKFSHSLFAFHVDVKRLMLSAVEKERKTEKPEYLWHFIFPFDCYSPQS